MVNVIAQSVIKSLEAEYKALLAEFKRLENQYNVLYDWGHEVDAEYCNVLALDVQHAINAVRADIADWKSILVA